MRGISSVVLAKRFTASRPEEVVGSAENKIPKADDMAQQEQKKPNILVIMGDDIGWFNPSIYNRGMMSYRTPNIDRIGNDGAMFTDWYGQQSCTAGRAAFITRSGGSPSRSSTTNAAPGAPVRLPCGRRAGHS